MKKDTIKTLISILVVIVLAILLIILQFTKDSKESSKPANTNNNLTLTYCTSEIINECFKEDGNYIGKKGTVGNNWLWYGGHLWRIMKEDKTEKSLTLITSYPVTALSWSDTIENGPSLEESYIGSWLNEVFYNSLPSNFKKNIIPHDYNRSIYKDKKIEENVLSNKIKVRLLTETELEERKALNNIKYNENYLVIDEYYWLADIGNESSISHVEYTGDLGSYYPYGQFGVRPVVKIKSELEISKGFGTMTDPYIVTKEKSKNTANIDVGEYINVPRTDGTNYLVRLVNNNEEPKVILNGLYKISEFNFIYDSILESFAKTLDTDYISMKKHNYNTSAYYDGSNWNSKTSIKELKVGLPSIGEIFSGDDINIDGRKLFADYTKILNPALATDYWLGNETSNNRKCVVSSIGSNSCGGHAEAKLGIRPVFYLKNNLSIVDGDGTANNPYTLK